MGHLKQSHFSIQVNSKVKNISLKSFDNTECSCLKRDTDAYRFGFNGQEKDSEVSGAGNSYTAEFWEYDPRFGRRWNVDPIIRSWESPYATFSNNPIYYVDVSRANPGTHESFYPTPEGKAPRTAFYPTPEGKAPRTAFYPTPDGDAPTNGYRLAEVTIRSTRLYKLSFDVLQQDHTRVYRGLIFGKSGRRSSDDYRTFLDFSSKAIDAFDQAQKFRNSTFYSNRFKDSKGGGVVITVLSAIDHYKKEEYDELAIDDIDFTMSFVK